ncbi:unannotated protein [freshwater metagenome]|uniref:Unannotated protein n=1 Tax=freshwater metagenome TaxID=449393 RepID=A0A6J7JA13_9ZZZZ
MRVMRGQAGVRLVPRWYPPVVIGLLTLFTLGFLALALNVDGAMGISAWGLFAFAALLLCAAVSALARPRRRREPRVTPDGVRVFVAPALTTWPLVGAWLAVLVVAGVWSFVAVTDFGALESPGFTLVTIVGAVGSLPDLVRLLTGRLHRWRLEIGPETLTYRGYRTDRSWSWTEVRGARIQQRGPAGVAIDLRGAGTDPIVPITAFDVPAEQLVEEINRAKAAARR